MDKRCRKQLKTTHNHHCSCSEGEVFFSFLIFLYGLFPYGWFSDGSLSLSLLSLSRGEQHWVGIHKHDRTRRRSDIQNVQPCRRQVNNIILWFTVQCKKNYFAPLVPLNDKCTWQWFPTSKFFMCTPRLECIW